MNHQAVIDTVAQMQPRENRIIIQALAATPEPLTRELAAELASLTGRNTHGITAPNQTRLVAMQEMLKSSGAFAKLVEHYVQKMTKDHLSTEQQVDMMRDLVGFSMTLDRAISTISKSTENMTVLQRTLHSLMAQMGGQNRLNRLLGHLQLLDLELKGLDKAVETLPDRKRPTSEVDAKLPKKVRITPHKKMGLLEQTSIRLNRTESYDEFTVTTPTYIEIVRIVTVLIAAINEFLNTVDHMTYQYVSVSRFSLPAKEPMPKDPGLQDVAAQINTQFTAAERLKIELEMIDQLKSNKPLLEDLKASGVDTSLADHIIAHDEGIAPYQAAAAGFLSALTDFSQLVSKVPEMTDTLAQSASPQPDQAETFGNLRDIISLLSPFAAQAPALAGLVQASEQAHTALRRKIEAHIDDLLDEETRSKWLLLTQRAGKQSNLRLNKRN